MKRLSRLRTSREEDNHFAMEMHLDEAVQRVQLVLQRSNHIVLQKLRGRGGLLRRMDRHILGIVQRQSSQVLHGFSLCGGEEQRLSTAGQVANHSI